MKSSTNIKFHFNTFTIDFNEELNGIYGGTMTPFFIRLTGHL